MIQLSEIDTQDASTLVCNHMICKHCGVIDRDSERMRVGSTCKTCDKVSNGGLLAFPINIHMLVDLVQQAYHSKPLVSQIYGAQSPAISTVLFFCALREVLINKFLEEHLLAKKMPKSYIQENLNDKTFLRKKFTTLFTSTIGVKWDRAIEQASQQRNINFSSTSDFMQNAADTRNKFLHRGHTFLITYEFATDCVNTMPLVIELFVALHNLFTYPLLSKNTQSTTSKIKLLHQDSHK